ncbi:hypothetical protein FQU76_09075 [Streptomyces qinzhouensis]|uniref:Uncharacterized protein n=1 Tax=Streptomyces qinzhouensis TaxID=2599401 RepID=A0A5B8JG04_9ACTN|nr:hypothetical protein FQU76_09075 [Streptomyces qinzhouensis]
MTDSSTGSVGRAAGGPVTGLVVCRVPGSAPDVRRHAPSRMVIHGRRTPGPSDMLPRIMRFGLLLLSCRGEGL